MHVFCQALTNWRQWECATSLKLHLTRPTYCTSRNPPCQVAALSHHLIGYWMHMLPLPKAAFLEHVDIRGPGIVLLHKCGIIMAAPRGHGKAFYTAWVQVLSCLKVLIPKWNGCRSSCCFTCKCSVRQPAVGGNGNVLLHSSYF